jgi:hypothetical protein
LGYLNKNISLPDETAARIDGAILALRSRPNVVARRLLKGAAFRESSRSADHHCAAARSPDGGTRRRRTSGQKQGEEGTTAPLRLPAALERASVAPPAKTVIKRRETARCVGVRSR